LPNSHQRPYLNVKTRSHLGFTVLLTSLLAGCASYQAVPVDLHELLDQFDQNVLDPADPALANPSESVNAKQLAAFAVRHNPGLQLVRAQVGVRESLLEQAGLLPNPEFGWDGMDVLANQISGDGASSVDFLSGLGISFPLLRPGERDALKGVAGAELEQAKAEVLEAEWRLAGLVYLASENLLEAAAQWQLNQELTEVATATQKYFEDAKTAGTATAIQASLAQGDLLAIQTEGLRRQARLRETRQQLNALLGLPPDTPLPLVPMAEQPDMPTDDPAELVHQALELRPDVAVLRAAYQAAEETVRLEVRRQFPQLSIGTAFSIIPGLFNHWNRPAIRTAEAQRQRLADALALEVHQLRQEIYDSYYALRESEVEYTYMQEQVLPNVLRSRQLAEQSLEAGEVTLLEILAVQRFWVDVRTKITETQAELARRKWQHLTMVGALLAESNPAPKP
jgi:outer membrane protein, heavy metal efflux system